MKSYIGIGKGKVELAVDEAVRGIGRRDDHIFKLICTDKRCIENSS